jgi:phosphate uptake regulator
VPDDPGKPRYINEAALGAPSIALADAAREVLRMVDVVESMLRMFLGALRSDDRKLLARIGAMDDTLDRLHNAIKLHLSAISREDGLSEADAKRCSDILAFTIKLEHIGDILDRSLRELAAKKIKLRLTFSEEGLREIEAMHERLLDNLHLATSVFMLGDMQAARALLTEKDRMRDLEQAATDNHLQRLREGRVQSIETSSLHIDIARDLKRIAAHIASVAYPILERAAPCAAAGCSTKARAWAGRHRKAALEPTRPRFGAEQKLRYWPPLKDVSSGSRPERLRASIALLEYLNEQTFAGMSSQIGAAPAERWSAVAPPSRGKLSATEPRLAGSRGSRPIRVTVARPARMIAQGASPFETARAIMIVQATPARSPHLQPSNSSCSAEAPFLRTGLRPVNAVARSGRQGWPSTTAGLFLTGASRMASFRSQS